MRLINTNLLNYFYKKGIKPLADQINNKFDKSKMLNTLEEIKANTRSEYGAGALAVKEINSNLSELGTVYNNFTENIASGTNIDGNKFYNVCNITLQAGVYIVVGKVNVSLKQSVSILQGFYADGNRYGENSLKSDQRYVESIHLFKLSKATTIYLRTHISSTLSAIGTVYAREMYAIKLK